MRIVVPALRYYPDQPTGSSRLAYDEAVWLARAGHDVWMIAESSSETMASRVGAGDGVAEHVVDGGIHVLRYTSPSLPSFDPRRAGSHQRLVRDVLSRHLVGPVDLVHGHALLQSDGAFQLLGSGTRRCYTVHSPVGEELRAKGIGAPRLARTRLLLASLLAGRVERRCLSLPDAVTAESEFTKSRLESAHGRSLASRVEVIPGWVDLNRFQIRPDRAALKARLGWATDVPVLFTLRRLVRRMGLDRLLLAARIAGSRGHRFHLYIGGGGPLQSELYEHAAKLGLADCVHFVGRVPDETLPLMYAAADAFVLPTAALECFGLITIEALACGRPVLATPVGATPEVLRHFESGWLSASADADAFAHHLGRFLAGELPAHPPEELRARVAERYSQEQVLPQLIATALGAKQGQSKTLGSEH